MSKLLFYTFLFIFLLAEISVTGQQAILKRQTISNTGGSISMNYGESSLLIQQSVAQSSPVIINNQQEARPGFIQPHLSGNLKSISSELEATVFPNPFDQSVSIEFKEQQFSPIRVTILDVSGRVVHEQTFHISNSKRAELHQLELVNGSYVITLTSENKIFSSILIKS